MEKPFRKPQVSEPIRLLKISTRRYNFRYGLSIQFVKFLGVRAAKVPG